MNLKAYLAENHITAKEFSKLIDCEYSYISKLMNGKRHPGRRLARDIERMTNGSVRLLPESEPMQKVKKAHADKQ